MSEPHLLRIKSSIVIMMLTSLILIPHLLCSQAIIGLGTRYNDSYREWTIVTDDEEIVGEMHMRWAFRNDWTEWDLRIGDITATLQQKWKEDPNLWEIQCGDVIVNARTTWPGVFNRWKLNDGKHQFNWGTKYDNMRDEWLIDVRSEDLFKVHTYWTSDTRDWVVEDNLPEDVSMAMKLAMIFLAIHFSTPQL